MAEYIEREEIMNRLFTEYATDSKADVFELIRSIPAADVQSMRRILQIVQGRLNGVNYTMSEAIKSNDTDTAYKMKGAIDICNEILADLKALTAKDGDTNG